MDNKIYNNIIEIDQQQKKVCIKCRQNKSIIEFCKNKNFKDGRNNQCKACVNQNSKNHYNNNKLKYKLHRQQYYIQNKIHINETNKGYRDNNIENEKIRNKLYRNTHSEQIKEYNKTYNQTNKEKIKEYHQQYNKHNRSKITDKARAYREANREHCRKYKNNYEKNRLKNDSEYKFLCAIRKSTYRSLSYDYKHNRTHELLCCTPKEGKAHIEKQFRDGMTWENWGTVWEVDHIIPLNWFKENDLNDTTNIKIAHHWGNLQPLLVHENRIKSDNVPTNTNFKY